MKRKFTFLSLLTLMTLSREAYAQDKCGTTDRLRELYSKHPELRADHEAFLRNCFSNPQVRSGDSTVVYSIPVVFHILHEYDSHVGENITDDQVRDAIRIMNEDFRRQNPDTALIVPVFKPLAADAHIEFRLASLDPQGNCTNGIIHHFSHETVNGDDYSKIDAWPRGSYLNIWVSDATISGAAAYAYQPTDVANLPYAAFDGIVAMHNYVGSIGTSNPNNQHTLTHEVGHYLSLPHIWGNTNEPGVACGDDGLADTPVTEGHTSCTAADLNDQSCTPGVIENTQNFMDYSYCNHMYTFDQKFAMRSALESSISNRNNLWSETNHTATGINVIPAPVCTPVPDMHPSARYICFGSSVVFNDDSWRADVDTWSWSFPGGTPATSTATNPTVTYNTPGWHDVTLTVTNSAGTETKVFNQAVHVSNAWADFTGIWSESFENATSSGLWVIENPELNEAGWHRVNTVAATGTHAFKLNNHKDIDIFSLNYFNQLGGNHDALISPSFDLSNMSGVTFSFKYSCATHATTLANQTEVLRVFTSENCGRTWVQRAIITGAELANAGIVAGEYVPTPGLWTTKVINLPASALDPNVRFKFEYTASDYSNNIYIDDININGVVGVGEMVMPEFGLSVYPNPSGTSQEITVAFEGNNEPLQLVVTDVVGKNVYTAQVAAANGKITHAIAANVLSSGMYMVTLTNGTFAQSVKFVKQ